MGTFDVMREFTTSYKKKGGGERVGGRGELPDEVLLRNADVLVLVVPFGARNNETHIRILSFTMNVCKCPHPTTISHKRTPIARPAY